MHSLNYAVDILMSKAYFLLIDEDFNPLDDDIISKAGDVESSTHLECIDHIFFDDEDQITPYIAY